MRNLKFLNNNYFFNYFIVIMVVFLLQSCKVFQDPISLSEAANNTSNSVIKVTMLNGDEYIYDKIEVNNEQNFIGINKRPNEILETPLLNSQIKSIQVQNKKSSTLSNVLGFTIGIGAVVLGILML